MVYIHFAEGFEEIEALTCVDLMRRVGIDAITVSITGEQIVKSVRNIGVQTDILYEDADYQNCEMIVLPGGMPGAKNLGNHDGLVKHIKCFAENGKWIAAICAAPMVFAQNGLLKGKKATIYPGMEENLADAIRSNDRVVIDGNIITSKGPGTAMEFTLSIVELLKGKAVAEKLRLDIVMD